MSHNDNASINAPSVAFDDDDYEGDRETFRAIASSIYSADDPLALRPPVGESPAERAQRLQAEAHARRVSNEIDARIKKEKRDKKKAGKEVKLLLLGQAESGKSTLLKQWQLAHDRETIEKSRASYRAVIYHNISHVVRVVLTTLESHDDNFDPEGTGGTGTPSSVVASSIDVGTPLASPRAPYSPTPAISGAARSRTPAQNELATLRLRLSPLVALEAQLAHRLAGRRPGEDPPRTPSSHDVAQHIAGAGPTGRPAPRDTLVVRPGWMDRAVSPPNNVAVNGGGLGGSSGGRRRDNEDLVADSASVLRSSLADVTALWTHPMVVRLLDRRRLRFDDWAAHFLSAPVLARVTDPEWTPTIDDVLRARIRTQGVEEHSLLVPQMHGRGQPQLWKLYDVGGARGQRTAWISYFEDTSAIIFLAPVSAFDQWLDEDPRTNRLDDSMKLFEMVSKSPLLERAILVLFLNKVDVLRRKLGQGIRVSKYITSFGDRPNEERMVLEYFKGHFQNVFRRCQHEQSLRELYTHFTTAIDVQQTQAIIKDVKDSIFRTLLNQAAMTD